MSIISPFKVLLLLSASLLVTGCGGSSAQETPIDFQQVTPAMSSAIAERTTVVVRDSPSWDELWKKHTSSISSGIATPAINFSQKMVIGLFLGQRSSSCYQVNIAFVTQKQKPERIEVGYQEITPDPAAMCLAVITNPSAIITLPTSALPVEFVRLP